MIKAVVIDDEYRVRQVLITLLGKFCPEVMIIGEADSVKSGVKIIEENKPELVFLDIEMNDGTGFDILTQIKSKNFETIFVTSYDHYAIKAIRYSAFDYLLKPILIEDLKSAITRFQEKRDAIDENKYNYLQENLNNDELEKKLILNAKNKIESIVIKEILYLEADGNYTTIVLIDGKKYVVSKTMKEYENILCFSGSIFVRVHKTFIVNTKEINTLEKNEQLTLILNNGKEITVARSRRQSLIDIWSK